MTRGRVLVIDDNDHVCTILKQGLERRGMSVITASNACDGSIKGYRGMKKDDKLDLIVLDLKLSEEFLGESGFDILKYLWEDREYDVPVMLHSAFVGTRACREAIHEVEKLYGGGRKILSAIPKGNPAELIEIITNYLAKDAPDHEE